MKLWHGLLVWQLTVLFSIVFEWTEALSSAASEATDIAGAFDAWLDANGAHRAVRTRDYRAAGLGFGFEATRALRPGDRALLVPLRLHVAASNALRRSSAAPWFFAGAQQRWSFAEQPFVLFWLHEAAVRGRDSFYAPYLRLMAASMRCPHRGSAVVTDNATTTSATEVESAETDSSATLESTDAWQRAWAWLNADHTPDCSHPLYWSGGAAEFNAAFQRASAADDVVALRRSLRARYRDTIDRLIAPHAAHTGLAPTMVTFRDFVWAFLLHGSRTWALPRFQPPPADADSLRALRAELASRLLVPSGCAASLSPESSAAADGAGATSASCQARATARETSAPSNDASAAAAAAAAFVPPWADADERDAAIAASEGHTFLPGIDVFNHVRHAPDVAMRVTRDGLYAEAVALRPIAAGAQVWISYGPQANLGMLLGFNFALAPVRFRALAPFAARGDAEFVHAEADAATMTTTTTTTATTTSAVHSMDDGASLPLERVQSLVAIAADYLSEATTANRESSLESSSTTASSASLRRRRRGTSAASFLPVPSNVTVLVLSVALPPALLTPPLVAIFAAAAGVDAHRIRVPVTAAPASLDELLKFLRIMHLTATHELTLPPVSTNSVSPTAIAPDSFPLPSSSNPPPPPSSSSSSPSSSPRPALRSPLEHCVAHLLAASTAPLPLSLPNELAALRRARQLADELLRAYATDARADAARLFEDRLVALLNAAMADAGAQEEAQVKRPTRTDREARDESRVDGTVAADADAANVSAQNETPTRVVAHQAHASPASTTTTVMHENESAPHQQQQRRLESTALDAARSARDRLRPLDAKTRAAISVRLEEKLALEALRSRVRARWLRILDTGVLHAGGAEEAAADGDDGHQDDGDDQDVNGDAAAAAAAAASKHGGAQSADGDASIPVAPAGFDWCARTLADQ